MTRGRSSIATLVALLATIAAGACRDDRVTLAVARDGGAGSGGGAGGPGVAGAGGTAGGGGSDTGGIDASAGVAGTGSAGTGGAGAGCATDGGLDGAPERNDAPAGTWVTRTPCVIPSGVPESRGLPAVAFDADRRKLLLYGGQGLTDLWELDVPTATWTSRNNCGAHDAPAMGARRDSGLRPRWSSTARAAGCSCSRATRAWSGSGIRTPPSGPCVRPRREPPRRPGFSRPWSTMRRAARCWSSPTSSCPISRPTRTSRSGSGTAAPAPGSSASPTASRGCQAGLPALAFDAGRGALWMFGGSQNRSPTIASGAWTRRAGR